MQSSQDDLLFQYIRAAHNDFLLKQRQYKLAQIFFYLAGSTLLVVIGFNFIEDLSRPKSDKFRLLFGYDTSLQHMGAQLLQLSLLGGLGFNFPAKGCYEKENPGYTPHAVSSFLLLFSLVARYFCSQADFVCSFLGLCVLFCIGIGGVLLLIWSSIVSVRSSLHLVKIHNGRLVYAASFLVGGGSALLLSFSAFGWRRLEGSDVPVLLLCQWGLFVFAYVVFIFRQIATMCPGDRRRGAFDFLAADGGAQKFAEGRECVQYFSYFFPVFIAAYVGVSNFFWWNIPLDEDSVWYEFSKVGRWFFLALFLLQLMHVICFSNSTGRGWKRTMSSDEYDFSSKKYCAACFSSKQQIITLWGLAIFNLSSAIDTRDSITGDIDDSAISVLAFLHIGFGVISVELANVMVVYAVVMLLWNILTKGGSAVTGLLDQCLMGFPNISINFSGFFAPTDSDSVITVATDMRSDGDADTVITVGTEMR